MALRVVRHAAVLLAFVVLGGCGDGRLSIAPVKGVVTCGGKPVTSGSISFTPVVQGSDAATGARPASGAVQPDGTFVLSTYEANDGAVIGKHTVWYTPPAADGEGEGEESEEEGAVKMPPPLPPKPGDPCRFGGKTEAEVVSGDNDLKIELMPLNASGEEGDESGAY